MKLAICGSRDLDFNINTILRLIVECKISTITEVVSGGASGIDKSAKDFAEEYVGYYKEFPADWKKHGKSAGPRRNQQIAAYSDGLLVIWDGNSRGSKNCKEEFLKLNKPIYEIIIRKYNGIADYEVGYND
jgi:predicted Rossmann fold nucleotide-binding protein DprA/Smf involved in DNA uptake